MTNLEDAINERNKWEEVADYHIEELEKAELEIKHWNSVIKGELLKKSQEDSVREIEVKKFKDVLESAKAVAESSYNNRIADYFEGDTNE